MPFTGVEGQQMAGSSQELHLSFHQVGSGDRTQVVRHSGKHLCTLSHRTGLTKHLKKNFPNDWRVTTEQCGCSFPYTLRDSSVWQCFSNLVNLRDLWGTLWVQPGSAAWRYQCLMGQGSHLFHPLFPTDGKLRWKLMYPALRYAFIGECQLLGSNPNLTNTSGEPLKVHKCLSVTQLPLFPSGLAPARWLESSMVVALHCQFFMSHCKCAV